MRRSISILAITGALFAASPGHTSGIPTFDGANVSQALAQLLQMKLTHGVEEKQLGKLTIQVLEAIKTVTALQRQIDQLERQYESLTGSRGMGGLLNGTTEKKARRIADTLSDINETLLGVGVPASNPLSAQIATLRDTYQIPDAAELFDANRVPAKVAAHNFASASTSTAIVLSEDAFTRANTSISRVESLLASVDTTPDLKASVDINTRMMAELAFMMADQSRLDAAASQMQAALANETLRDRETGKRRLDFKE
jgi:hypothetical protein